MKARPFIFGPYTIFFFSLAGLALVLFLLIHWYQHFDNNGNVINLLPYLKGENQSLKFIIVLTTLIGFIVMCLAIIITYFYKIDQLYKLQESFLNNFTHELKTPIASISLYLETLKKYDLDREEQKEFIIYMLQDAKRLSNNVQQILQIARIENRFKNHTFERVDLEKTIQDFLRLNDYLFKKGEIEIINKVAGPIFLNLNTGLFEILLMNLITNALKYSKSKAKLNITLMRKRNRTTITFKDNGIGIKKADLKKIFRKFQRVHQSHDAIGTGIGLYSAKQIMNLHKGSITAESEGENKGSTFKLTFPKPSAKELTL